MVHPRCIVGNKPQRVAFEVFKRFQVHPKRDRKCTATKKKSNARQIQQPSPPKGPMQCLCDAFRISNRALRELRSNAARVVTREARRQVNRTETRLFNTEWRFETFNQNERPHPRCKNNAFEPTNGLLSPYISPILGL